MINLNDVIPLTDGSKDLVGRGVVSMVDRDIQLSLASVSTAGERVHTSRMSLRLDSLTKEDRTNFELTEKLQYFIEDTERSYRYILNVGGSLYLGIDHIECMITRFKEVFGSEGLTHRSVNFTQSDLNKASSPPLMSVFDSPMSMDPGVRLVFNQLNLTDKAFLYLLTSNCSMFVPYRYRVRDTHKFNYRTDLVLSDHDTQRKCMDVLLGASLLCKIESDMEDIASHEIKGNILTFTSKKGRCIKYFIGDGYVTKINMDDGPLLYLSPKCLGYILKQHDLMFLRATPMVGTLYPIGYDVSENHSEKKVIIGNGDSNLILSDMLSRVPFLSGLISDMTMTTASGSLAFTRKFFSLSQVLTIHATEINTSKVASSVYA